MMDLKTAAISLGVGMMSGAAVVLMLPKHSEAYRMANRAAKTVKVEAVRMMDNLKKN